VFNAIQAAHIESDGRPAGSPDRRAHPIAGDDAAAKKAVADLLDEFGMPGRSLKKGASRGLRPRIAYQWIPASCRKPSLPV
jgi:predicted dinucleotide-binding enzyme